MVKGLEKGLRTLHTADLLWLSPLHSPPHTLHIPTAAPFYSSSLLPFPSICISHLRSVSISQDAVWSRQERLFMLVFGRETSRPGCHQGQGPSELEGRVCFMKLLTSHGSSFLAWWMAVSPPPPPLLLLILESFLFSFPLSDVSKFSLFYKVTSPLDYNSPWLLHF